MRLSRVLLAVSLSTGLVFAGTTATGTTPAGTDKPATTMEKAPPKAALIKITGKVETVDPIGNILVVKTAAKKVDSIAITSETKISNAGKDTTLSDVKVGENVRVLCKKEDGKLTATEVKVGVPAAPVKKAAATTTTTPTPPPAAPGDKK